MNLDKRNLIRLSLPGNVVALLVSALFATVLQAGPLRPDELLLIYNRDDTDSRKLAAYYAEVRGVPLDHIVGVRANAQQEEIARNDFERLIHKPVRQYMEKQQLRDKVRCLVTFYGLPIRVGPTAISASQRRLLQQWQREYRAGLAELNRANAQLQAIAVPTAPYPVTESFTENDHLRLLQLYFQLKAVGLQRVMQPNATAADAGNMQRILAVMKKVEGTANLLELMRVNTATQPDVAEQQLQEARDTVEAARAKARELLAGGREDPQRDEARKIVLEYEGLLATLASLKDDIDHFNPEESHAALDSELALLWWPDYPKNRWIWNTLNQRVSVDPVLRYLIPPHHWQMPTLMVSRIDASGPQVARRMIDQAIAAERTGLTGKIYLDARGLTQNEPGLGIYDQDLRNLADLIKSNTRLAVQLDNRLHVFGVDRCPNTMLYCGWYSLRRYVDAFDFVPGAVGYHLASFEAISLKQPDERGWCKRMLDDGITATLGAVAEPYLQSFPRPKDFFGLLLTGQFTLVECYAKTASFNSWMVMLLGDPLYRPFAKNPHLKVEQVFQFATTPPRAGPVVPPSP